MRHKQKELKLGRKKLTILGVATLLTLGLSLSTATAQESINTTGGNASGSGGSASYTIGQVAYTTNTGTGGSVAQGVQQAYEISTIIETEEARDINLLITAYPNPTTNYLTLEVNDFELTSLYFELYDMQGKLLQNKQIINNQTNIVTSNLKPATYFLKLIQSNKEVKTFKIIKN
ncbi:MAG: T9SS type A sorting domain-containing protein [Bacteroidales bacterium]|nr:T9SS type A sorting domain-containing protein [Bacteroidales bacterium]